MKLRTDSIYELEPEEILWAFRRDGGVDIQRVDISKGTGLVIQLATVQARELAKQILDIVDIPQREIPVPVATTNHVECEEQP